MLQIQLPFVLLALPFCFQVCNIHFLLIPSFKVIYSLAYFLGILTWLSFITFNWTPGKMKMSQKNPGTVRVSLDLEKKSFINACSQRKICKEMWKRRLWIRIVHVSSFILPKHNIFSNIITR